MTNFGPTKDLALLAQRLGTDEKGAKTALFYVADFMTANVTDEVLDCGAYHMPSYVGDANLSEAFKEMAFAIYEQFGEEKKPEAAGPWVHVTQNGLLISKERHVTLEDLI